MVTKGRLEAAVWDTVFGRHNVSITHHNYAILLHVQLHVQSIIHLTTGVYKCLICRRR